MSVIIKENNSISPSPYVVRAYRAMHELRYGYLLNLTKGEETHELKCEYTIKYVGKHQESENPIYQIVRSYPVYINEQEPDTMAEELAAQVGAGIYPLELEVSLQGEPLSICNYDQIFERWQKLKAELLEYYEGEVFLKYITLSEQALLACDILFEKIKQDWFIQTYFAPIRGKYEPAKPREAQLDLPICEHVEFVKYLSHWQLNTHIDEHGEMEIKGSGEVREERSAKEVEQGLDFPNAEETEVQSEKLKGSIDFVYKVNAQHHLIESAQGSCELLLETPLKVGIHLFNIGGNLPQEKSQQGSMVMVDKWANKGGFWSKIFKT